MADLIRARYDSRHEDIGSKLIDSNLKSMIEAERRSRINKFIQQLNSAGNDGPQQLSDAIENDSNSEDDADTVLHEETASVSSLDEIESFIPSSQAFDGLLKSLASFLQFNQVQDSSNTANVSAQTTGMKKRGGVLNFLTLKEPSISTWTEFAEAEEQANANAKQNSANEFDTGVHAISSPELPESVLRANSKWDGLPDSARRKIIGSKASSQPRPMAQNSSQRNANEPLPILQKSSRERSHTTVLDVDLLKQSFGTRIYETLSRWLTIIGRPKAGLHRIHYTCVRNL
jgi:hypothetical protein